MMERLAAIERKTSAKALYVVVLAALLALRSYVLFDPPYWDALAGAFAQAYWLAHHGLDAIGLMTTQLTYVDGGPNVYPFSVYPYFIALLYRVGLEPKHVFLVLHVVSFACTAAFIAGAFRLARLCLAAPFALLVALLLFCIPLVQAMACEINMDMPLAAFTVLSFVAIAERRFARAWLWAFFALAIKPTAIILIAANVATIVWIAWFPRTLQHDAQQPLARRRAWAAIAAYLALFALFAVQLRPTSSIAHAPAYVELLGGVLPLFGKRLWVMPEYGLALVAFLLALPFELRRVWRGQMTSLELQLVLFLAIFVGFYCQWTNPLPRYFLQSYPMLLVWSFALLARAPIAVAVRVALAFGACAFFAVNQHGRWYPRLRADWNVPGDPRPLWRNDGYMLERSMEYRDDLLLNQAICERLEKYPRERTIVVANWPVVQTLAIPEFGYVKERWRAVSPDCPLLYDEQRVDYGELYDWSGERPKKKTGDDVVFVLSPNVFSRWQTVFIPGVDRLVETIESGEHRAFVVERRGWE